MTQPRRIGWLDLLRGARGLIPKAPALVRAAGAMSLIEAGRPASLGAALERAARRWPDHAAVKWETGRWSYRDLNAQANRAAHALAALGVSRGDVVAVYVDSRPAVLALVAGAAKLGATASMLNVNQRRQALVHSVRCAPPKVIVVGEELAPAYQEIAPDLATDGPMTACYVADAGAAAVPAGWVDLDARMRAASAVNPRSTGQIRADERLCCIFTSGTTGLPKAANMSHRRWLGAGYIFGDCSLALSPGDTIYGPLPLYHNQGLTVVWASAVRTGAAFAMRRRFSASAFWDDCRRHDAVAIGYIGEIARYLLAQPERADDGDHPVLKAVGVGLRPSLWRAFKDRFGIDEVYEFYGASELNIIFINLLNLEGTVGFCPVPWAIVAFDADGGAPRRDGRGRLRRVRSGQAGLLLTKVSGAFEFEGYTDPEASERKLFRDVFRRGDRWVNTGDIMRHIGFGHLQFVDRAGDTFRWKGENVATGEVERAIDRRADIAESTVYGVEVPGCTGRAGMAAVVPTDPGDVDLDGLHAHLAAELPRYAVPVFIRVVTDLSVTDTFKHKKSALRDEGFDLARLDDPVFVRLPRAGCYVPLTPEMHDLIVAGAAGF